MSLTLFVIFHKTIYNIGYEINDVIYVSVNENIEKEIKETEYKILEEWTLPNYDPKFQALGYNESSAIIHIGLNKCYDTDFVGFTQYDMYIKKPNLLDKNTCYYAVTGVNFMLEPILPIRFFFEVYNEYFNEKLNLGDFVSIAKRKLGKMEIPLMSTFICHKDFYEKMYPFWKLLANRLTIYKKNPKGTSTHHRHIGGIMERFIGITLLLTFEKFEKLPCRIYDFSIDYPNRDKGDTHSTPQEIIDKYVN